VGALSGGINLGAPILPATDEDIFPTHDARYGKGGYRSVANNTERDAIPAERKEFGMVVRTRDTNLNWVWTPNTGATIITDGTWTLEGNTVLAGSEEELLNLTAAVGTIVTRTDTKKVYILQALPPTVLNNWLEMTADMDGGSWFDE
jgi:hypothetical protein